MLQTLAGNFQFEWYILKKESGSYKEYILILYRKMGKKTLNVFHSFFRKQFIVCTNDEKHCEAIENHALSNISWLPFAKTLDSK